MDLYTKNGKPLQTSGDIVYSKSGAVVGKIRGNKVFGTNGKYVGTVVNDRLIYRSTDSATIDSPFSAANHASIARANHASVVAWGDEPDIPE